MYLKNQGQILPDCFPKRPCHYDVFRKTMHEASFSHVLAAPCMINFSIFTNLTLGKYYLMIRIPFP